MSTSNSSTRANQPASTFELQFSRLVQSLRNACVDAVVRAEFDAGFKEGMMTLEMDHFLEQHCSLKPVDLQRAAKAGIIRAIAYIEAQPQHTPSFTSTLSVLSAEFVVVAFDGLQLARHQPAPRDPSPTVSRPPSRRSLPTRVPSDSELDAILGQIQPNSVHYRGCPRPNEVRVTCSTAFTLLDTSPCTHKGEWCTSVGDYPNFTSRLQRRFADAHSRNLPILVSDLEVPSIQADPQTEPSISGSEIMQCSEVQLNEGPWCDKVEAHDLAQALITHERDDAQDADIDCTSTSRVSEPVRVATARRITDPSHSVASPGPCSSTTSKGARNRGKNRGKGQSPGKRSRSKSAPVKRPRRTKSNANQH